MNAWVLFWLVGVIWGSSFMLIRIGVESIHPLHVVFVRVGIASAGLLLVVVARRQKIPRDWRTIAALLFIGFGNNAVPFTLISYGEQTVESGLASVLQATAALFGLIIAGLSFKDERITAQKVVGLLLGFGGIIVLASRNWQGGEIMTGGLVGQLMIVGASVFYATFTTLSKKLIQGDIAPIVVAAFALTGATLTEGVFILFGAAVGDVPLTMNYPVPADALLAVLGLGFINTFLAYLMFYQIVRVLGAAKATMVTYVVPVVGMFMGVVFLNEQLDVFIIGGAALIFTGIAVVNLKLFARLNRREAAALAGD